MNNELRKKLIVLVIVLAATAGILVGLSNFYTELLWFEELGFKNVYVKMLVSQFGMGFLFGFVALAFLGLHLLLIRKHSSPRREWVIPTASGDIIDIKDVVKRVTTPVVAAAAIVVAAIFGFWASQHWEDALRALNAVGYGKAEPILGEDIGFYFFMLPLYEFVQEWLIYLSGAGLLFSAAVYFLRGSITLHGWVIQLSRSVRNHLLFGLAVVLLVVSWGWRVEMFELLFSKRGIAYGATYTDVHVNLIFYRIMIGACVLGAIALVVMLFLRLGEKRDTQVVGIIGGTVLAMYLFGTFAWPALVQQFVVNPNELDKERPYLVNAVEGTRTAYGLDKIESKEFPSEDNLSAAALKENEATIENIKIWDHRPLKATYKQMQVIRLYYDFPTINVDRYYADNQYWQVMLSTREMQTDQLPEQSRTWVNKHLQYTHGYGVCLSPVKRVVGEGLPDLWIKDIPPESRYPHLKIDRPEIYFGMATDDYVLVKTATQEFDYPLGNDNKYTTYAGEAGVNIGSFFRRMLFAMRFGDVNLLFTSYLQPESRILFNRNIQERLFEAAPFLMPDQEPYMVVSEGRLYWVIDAYTTSHRYPYSQPTPLGSGRRLNYIRNSVKVVIDAYSGKMDFYIWDEKDPIVLTYQKIFPSMFKMGAQMPAELRKHMRYPKDLFTVQAVMYESFHMTDPQVFYNQEDKWSVSRELGEKTVGRQKEALDQVGVTAKQVTSTSRMDPYYMIMRLPEEKNEEYLLMVPFTPSNKDNMVAWMAARCDENDYGRLLVYTFPKKKLVFGPMQVEARIDQDEYISQWFTLRNQQGSTVIRGDLLVIPINKSILYVEPIYLEATQTKLPELKQVVVSFGKKLTMKESLYEALADVFDLHDGRRLAGGKAKGEAKLGGPATQPAVTATAASEIPGSDETDPRKLLDVALKSYDSAQQKVATGDWAGYGAKQQELRKALERLAQQLEAKFKPAAQTPAAPAPAPAASPSTNAPAPSTNK